jgi:hypothetical protein
VESVPVVSPLTSDENQIFIASQALELSGCFKGLCWLKGPEPLCQFNTITVIMLLYVTLLLFLSTVIDIGKINY